MQEGLAANSVQWLIQYIPHMQISWQVTYLKDKRLLSEMRHPLHTYIHHRR